MALHNPDTAISVGEMPASFKGLFTPEFIETLLLSTFLSITWGNHIDLSPVAAGQEVSDATCRDDGDFAPAICFGPPAYAVGGIYLCDFDTRGM
jgi:hypothetical protein